MVDFCDLEQTHIFFWKYVLFVCLLVYIRVLWYILFFGRSETWNTKYAPWQGSLDWAIISQGISKPRLFPLSLHFMFNCEAFRWNINFFSLPKKKRLRKYVRLIIEIFINFGVRCSKFHAYTFHCIAYFPGNFNCKWKIFKCYLTSLELYYLSQFLSFFAAKQLVYIKRNIMALGKLRIII